MSFSSAQINWEQRDSYTLLRPGLFRAAISTLFFVSMAASGFSAANPEPPGALTLAEAENIALRQAPEIAAAYFNARAADQKVREERSGFFPQVTAEVAAVGVGNDIVNAFGGGSHIAATNTRLGSTGGLNNPTVLDRESNGVIVSQLITDFGRTANLTAAARFDALSTQNRSALARAAVLLAVDEAYFRALGSQSLLRVASQTVAARQTVLDQISALAQSNLKSSLDLNFASVALGEAKMLVLQAQISRNQAFAALSAALGFKERHEYRLVDEPPAPLPPAPLSALVAQGLQYRPEALALRAERDAAKRFASAEMEARLPKISALGDFGRTVAGDSASQGNYTAAGVIVDLPAFTGGLLSSRYHEAVYRAKSAEQNLEAEEDQIAKGVNDAWLDADGARQKMPVAEELLASAREALDLAQSRYQLGSTSIVELSQAQLSAIQAEIGYASAKYDYQLARARLDFETGTLKNRALAPSAH